MAVKRTVAADELAIETEPIAEVAPAIEPKPKIIEPAEQNGGFAVYLGPSIRGVIQGGTIYGCSRAEAIKRVSAAVEKYPLISDLIVPGETFAQDRVKVKTPGNLLHKYYIDLATLVAAKN